MTTSSRRIFVFFAAAVLLGVFLGTSAHAIQPQRWVHSTEADFEAGEFDGVVATNLGDLKLATGVEVLGELPEEVTVVYDLAVVGDTTYVAAGPAGKLLKLQGGEITEVADLPDHQVFALLPSTEGFVTAALSGAESKLVSYDAEGQVTREISLPEDVRYVWDMATRDDGQQLVLATGPEGKVLGVSVDGEVEELLDAAQANVLCLAEGDDGEVYAGTDTDGLVYRIDADGTAFVVYDAAEPEIGAILFAEDGNVYFGTADAEQARPGRMESAAAEETGRPAPAGGGENPAVDPVPVEPPDELPGEPNPQPLDAAAATDNAAEAASAAAPTPNESTENADVADAPAADDNADVPDPGDTVEAEDAAPPSPERYDALREEIRKRLLAARESGAIARGKSAAARPTRNARPAASSSGGSGGGGAQAGNAVYRLDPRGFVAEVFRESVIILKLAELPDGHLLVGTGSEGQLYRLDPAAGESAVLNDLEPEQLLALSISGDGVLVAGSNPASLLSLSDTPAESGTFTSQALDATHISLWGAFQLTAALAPGTSVSVETRSGNVADPEVAAWSEWSAAGEMEHADDHVPLQPHEFKVTSPPARFLQYRLTLHADDAEVPTVGKIELAYVTPNLRPAVSSLTAAYPDFAGVDQPASPTMSVNWEATDENGDRLLYDLQYRPAAGSGSGPDASGWLTLAEDLTDTSFDWDTRKVPDGRYHLRVTADDRLDNPGKMAMTARRLADPVLIDNTPPQAPEVGDEPFTIKVTGRTATLTGVARDRLSPIHSVAYTLDDAEQPTPVLPDDLIYDSTTEAWSATLPDLSPGGHAVTVRTLDARGNVNYASKLFEVK